MVTIRRIGALAILGLSAVGCSENPRMTGTGPTVESLFASAASAAANEGAGAVYLMSNASGGNEIIAFNRAFDGQLSLAGTYPTGGSGTGSGLGNQASLTFSNDYRRLYAVNAGSNDVSVLAATPSGLQLIGTPVSSGGERPISLTVHGDLLYVLNAGGAGNIAGFRLGMDGELTPITGSVQRLSSSAAGPAQIQFSPDGRILVVTEKSTNMITTYVVNSDGTASGPHSYPSAGQTPFGFNFNQRGDLIVSEAFGGAAGASTASSYRLDSDGSVQLITGPVATTQTAACWIAISQNGGVALTANTGSGTLSSLAVGPGGALTLVDAAAAVTGTGSLPQDAAFTPGGRFLYVRNNGGTVGAFRSEGNGELTHIGDFALSSTANGIAVR